MLMWVIMVHCWKGDTNGTVNLPLVEQLVHSCAEVSIETCMRYPSMCSCSHAHGDYMFSIANITLKGGGRLMGFVALSYREAQW